MFRRSRSTCRWWLLAPLALLFSCHTVQRQLQAQGEEDLRTKVFARDELLPNDPRITFGTLENGFQYALVKNDTPKDRVIMMLDFNVGSINERDDQRGLAHFLEHLAFRRSKHFPGGDVIKQMQNAGVTYGAELNASTGFLTTSYKIDLPNNQAAMIDLGMNFFCDLCDGLTFNEDDVRQERGAILSEKRDNENVGKRLSKSACYFYYPESIFPKRFPIGVERVISQATVQDLQAFHDQWYTPNRSFLIIVGNIDITEMQQRIQQNFGTLPSKHADDPDRGKLTIEPLRVFYFSDPDLLNTEIGFSSFSKNCYKPGTYLDVKYNTAMGMIMGVLYNRLTHIQQEHPSLFRRYEVDFSRNNLFPDFSSLDLSITCEFEHWKECFAFLEQEFRKLRLYGVTESELQHRKDCLLQTAETYMKQEATRSSWAIASGLSETHLDKVSFPSPQMGFQLAQRFVQEIDLGYCNAIIKDLGDNFCLYMSTNNHLSNAKQTLIEAFEDSKKVEISKPLELKKTDWPYACDDAPLCAIIERKEISEFGITQLTLANNVKINLKPTDFKKDDVILSIYTGEGKLVGYPTINPATRDVALGMFLEGGLKKLSWKDLQPLLQAKRVGLVAECDSLGVCLSGSSNFKHLPFLLELATAYLTEPAFSEQSFIQIRKAAQSAFDNAQKSALNVYSNYYSKFITGNDALFGLCRQEDFFAVTREEACQFLEPILLKSPLEVTLVGDFELEPTILDLQRILGQLPKRESAFKPIDIALQFPESKPEAKNFYFTGDEKRALIVVSYKTNDFFNIHENRKLSVLASVLQERAYDKIREKKGLIYSCWASNSETPFKDFGYFNVAASIHPETFEEVKSDILKVIEELKITPIDQAEFTRIREPILNNVRDNLRENGFWMEKLNISQRYPLFIDSIRTYAQDYENITPQDLLETAQKYLNNPVISLIKKQEFSSKNEGTVAAQNSENTPAPQTESQKSEGNNAENKDLNEKENLDIEPIP